MKIDKVTIISGVVAGGVTYFVSKKNWKLAIVGLVVGGVAGYFINQQMNKPKSIPMPVVNDAENEEQSSFDESVEPRFQWNPIINQMMPVGQVNETYADGVYDVSADGLDLDFE
jgi:hypothetical protein